MVPFAPSPPVPDPSGEPLEHPAAIASTSAQSPRLVVIIAISSLASGTEPAGARPRA
jgi:hypothetical protein